MASFLEKPPAAAHGVAYQILRNREDAEEAVAQAVCLAWEHAADHRGDAPLLTWFVSIVRNVALMEHRRRRSAAAHSPEIARRRPRVWTPEALVMARERRRLTARAIASLPDTYRTAVHLVYGEGLTLAAAGRRMGVTEDCCRSRLYRARQILGKRLTAAGLIGLRPAAAP